jgi:hypothetical protein
MRQLREPVGEFRKVSLRHFVSVVDHLGIDAARAAMDYDQFRLRRRIDADYGHWLPVSGGLSLGGNEVFPRG